MEMKIDKSAFGYDGGHFVIEPNGNLSDAGRGHEEYFEGLAEEELLPKASEADKKKMGLLQKKFYGEYEEGGNIDEFIVAYYFGYMRITTTSLDDKEFGISIDYLQGRASSKSIKASKQFVHELLDKFGKRLGDFEVHVVKNGDPWSEKAFKTTAFNYI